jgi:hypothetical protein
VTGDSLTMEVRINGTKDNYWHRYGLRQNPFPQLGKHEYTTAERQVNSLNGDPVKGHEDIRQRLRGFAPEFIELCIAQYRPDKRVRFTVTFPADR